MRFDLRLRTALLVLSLAPVAAIGVMLSGTASSAGIAGKTKVNIYDNTQNNWNVLTNDPDTGGPDPVIGFVNFRPTTPDDPTHIVLTVVLKGAAPSCGYSVQLIPQVFDPTAGLAPDGGRTGSGTAFLGDIFTNRKGHGSASFVADATLLPGTAPSGQITYAHVDIEDVDQDCVEKDGTNVEENEYGASGKPPGTDYDLPDNISWLQP
jgi:hypothetical protein